MIRSKPGSPIRWPPPSREPSEDLLGALARSIVDGILTAPEAGGILTILLSAGGESTTSLLGNAVRMLAEDQELQDHLRRNLDQVPLFVEEALRLESPFRYMMRTVPADTTLGGVEIPAGATVLLFWAAGNRDPNGVRASRRGRSEPAGPAAPRGIRAGDPSLRRRTAGQNRSSQRAFRAARSHEPNLSRSRARATLGRQSSWSGVTMSCPCGSKPVESEKHHLLQHRGGR